MSSGKELEFPAVDSAGDTAAEDPSWGGDAPDTVGMGDKELVPKRSKALEEAPVFLLAAVAAVPAEVLEPDAWMLPGVRFLLVVLVLDSTCPVCWDDSKYLIGGRVAKWRGLDERGSPGRKRREQTQQPVHYFGLSDPRCDRCYRHKHLNGGPSPRKSYGVTGRLTRKSLLMPGRSFL